MNRTLLRMVCFLCLAAVLAGCAIDYRERAVEKAREYAAKNARELSATQLDYIRYNDPYILDGLIHQNEIRRFPGTGHIRPRSDEAYTHADYDLMQQCMVWDVPGLDGQLVVVGTGRRDFMFWSADSVGIRTYVPENNQRDGAVKTARLFIIGSLDGMDETLQSVVRFSEPEFVTTTFVLEPEKSETGELQTPQDWLTYLQEAAAKVNPAQISAVWRHGDNVAVAAGYSPDSSLELWKPVKVLLLSAKELQQNTLKPESNNTDKD